MKCLSVVKYFAMRATCSIAISISTQSQGHDQGLLFKDQDKDLSSKDKDWILVLKESLRTRTRTRTNITACYSSDSRVVNGDCIAACRKIHFITTGALDMGGPNS